MDISSGSITLAADAAMHTRTSLWAACGMVVLASAAEVCQPPAAVNGAGTVEIRSVHRRAIGGIDANAAYIAFALP